MVYFAIFIIIVVLTAGSEKKKPGSRKMSRREYSRAKRAGVKLGRRRW